jgi:acyl-CoA reductase-like NAD-dependent aldehyde dehydrogenase
MPELSVYHQDRLPIGDDMVSAPTEPVLFPYDGSRIGTAPVGSPGLAGRALEHAVGVRPAVRRLPAHVRRSVLLAVQAELGRRHRELADLLVLETGKPLVDCQTEVQRATLTVQTAAEEVARIHGETVPLDLSPAGQGLTGLWLRQPIGVVVGITGFNYPLLLAAHKLAPAIAAGCPVIGKPAPQAPLAVLVLAAMFRAALREAGAPPGAVQVVTGDAAVGARLVTDRRIGAVSFTGSADVGHRIARAAAPAKVLLELGANSALIVAADADLEAAAAAVAQGGFYASGQACISVQRVLVERPVAPAFLDALLPRVAALQVGDPRLADTQVSALIDPAATKRVLSWIGQAKQAGARTLLGGTVSDGVLAPTVLLDVPDEVAAWDEEIFGPVVCVRTVAGFDEAVATANRSRYGLHASVFTSGLHRTMQAIHELDAGGVVINAVPGFRADNMPYGGVKDSGLGREGPRFAIEEFTVTRMAIINPLPPAGLESSVPS